MFATRDPVLLSWSGGKDSALALAALREDPSVEVVALLTTVTPAYDRISIHGVRRTLLERQSQSLGLAVHEIMLEPQSSNDAYDAAVERTMRDVRGRYPSVRRVAYGDLFLRDVRAYREERIRSSVSSVCSRSGADQLPRSRASSLTAASRPDWCASTRHSSTPALPAARTTMRSSTSSRRAWIRAENAESSTRSSRTDPDSDAA